MSPAGVKLGFADMLAAVSPGLPADVAALCVAADAVASAAVCPLIGLPAGPGSADPKQSMDGLEAMLLFAGKPFLGGEAPAAADYAVAATFFPLYTMVPPPPSPPPRPSPCPLLTCRHLWHSSEAVRLQGDPKAVGGLHGAEADCGPSRVAVRR